MPDTSARFLFADQGIISNPYDLYDDLRETEPVHQVSDGVYFLSRYEDCAAALLDRRLSNRPAPFARLNARNSPDFVGADIAGNLIAFRDAPELTKARKAIASEFMAFIRGQPPVLAALARDKVESLDQHSRFDFVSDIALPFAVESTCRLLGFPSTDAERLKECSSDLFFMFHAIPDRQALIRLNDRLAGFRAHTDAVLRAHLADPEDDLI